MSLAQLERTAKQKARSNAARRLLLLLRAQLLDVTGDLDRIEASDATDRTVEELKAACALMSRLHARCENAKLSAPTAVALGEIDDAEGPALPAPAGQLRCTRCPALDSADPAVALSHGWRHVDGAWLCTACLDARNAKLPMCVHCQGDSAAGDGSPEQLLANGWVREGDGWRCKWCRKDTVFCGRCDAPAPGVGTIAAALEHGGWRQVPGAGYGGGPALRCPQCVAEVAVSCVGCEAPAPDEGTEDNAVAEGWCNTGTTEHAAWRCPDCQIKDLQPATREAVEAAVPGFLTPKGGA